MKAGSPRALLVDGDRPFREGAARALRSRSFTVVVTGSIEAAVDAVKKRPFQLAIIDLDPTVPTRTWLVQAVRRIQPAIRLVALTRSGAGSAVPKALRQGADEQFAKPIAATKLVRALLQREPDSRARTPNRRLTFAIQEHIERVVADCDGNVSEAARQLGITRRSLQLRLKKYRAKLH